MDSIRNLLDKLFGRLGRQDFAVRLWDGKTPPIQTETASFTSVLNHPGALRCMFRLPIELSLGEALIYGDIDIEGDIHSAVAWIYALSQTPLSTRDSFTLLRQITALLKGEGINYHGRGPARLSGVRHCVRRLASHRAEAVRATDEVTYRTWRLYMAASAHGFEEATINVNQTLLDKPVVRRNPLPWTRAELYD